MFRRLQIVLSEYNISLACYVLLMHLPSAILNLRLRNRQSKCGHLNPGSDNAASDGEVNHAAPYVHLVSLDLVAYEFLILTLVLKGAM